MTARPPHLAAAALLAAAAAFLTGPAPAQDEAPPNFAELFGAAGGPAQTFDLPDREGERDRIKVTAALLGPKGRRLADAPADGATVTLAVTAVVPDGAYLVARTSPVGQAAELLVAETVRLEPAADDFARQREPKSGFDPIYAGVLEKFTGSITWTRPYRVLPGDGPVRLTGELRGAYCSSGPAGICVPVGKGDAPFAVSLGAPDPHPTPRVEVEEDTSTEPLRFEATPAVRGEPGPVSVVAELPAAAAVGETATLTITLDVADGYHVYAAEDAGDFAVPTSFEANPAGLSAVGDFVASREPETVENAGVVLREHRGRVSWSRDYTVTAADYGLGGSVTYQVCTDSQCLRPKTVVFTLGNVASPSPNGGASVAENPDTGEPADADSVGAGLADEFELPPSWLESAGLWLVLPVAMLGGFLLNFMPCVLPVIMLKAMSFSKQAGQSRGKIVALNLWYAAGVLAVFMTFAALTFGVGGVIGIDGFRWGDQTNSDPGKIVFTTIVFAMGLSMLGLFEIPVPGFIGAAASGSAGQKEGASGAFLGGVLTTLLATPCTGPFLGLVGGVAVGLASTNPLATLGIWAAMGVGFALPYLFFAVFPSATRFLPKPGNWMVRFKEFGGLALLGTALWLLSGLPYELYVPVLTGLLALAVGLWVIGRVIAHNDSPNRKYTLRAVAVAVTAAGVAFAVWLAPDPAAYAGAAVAGDRGEADGWETFDVARLNELRAAGETVLVEFTSGNCPNCRINERVAIDTAAAHDAYERLDITPMKAWIDRSDDAYVWHEKLGGFGVPHMAVFPGRDPDRPVVHEGLISAGAFLELLEEAAADAPVRTAGR